MNIMEQNDSVHYQNNLVDGLKIKTLNTSYLDEIHEFLNHNYIENTECGLKTIFHRDFLYWHLKNSLIIGLIYENKLVGVITAKILNMVIHGNDTKIPQLNLLCIHSKLRKLGLAKILIMQIKDMLHKMGYNYSFCITTYFDEANTPSEIASYAIPINLPKLKELGFLPPDHTHIKTNMINMFHLVHESDLEQIVKKLNKWTSQFDIRPIFTIKSAYQYLMPKKNIIYSFVKKGEDGGITDFISVIKTCAYSISTKQIIYTASINYYFYETMNLTDMVECLMQKLSLYGIDQLSFANLALNDSIRITKYLTHYHQVKFDNMAILHIDQTQMMIGYF
jgi:glycylpeptide N-tetradecanoyltransferase